MTLFDNVDEKTINIYREYGYDWDEPRYINIFRWLWNVKHFHPRIESFPGDEKNNTLVTLEHCKINSRKFKTITTSYDDAVIQIVNHIAEYNKEYFEKVAF
jgi:hypothetical protein